jgi:hypothetical protein
LAGTWIELGAEQGERVLLLLALRDGDDDDGSCSPCALATTASPMPVLPAVPSTMVPPGRSWPLRDGASLE